MSTIQQETAVPTGTFAADTVHSSVGFEVPYAVATLSGTVDDFEATLADGKLSGSARIASIQTKEENLQAHLLSPEFFDAERHPVLTFAGDLERDRDRRGHDQGHHAPDRPRRHDRRTRRRPFRSDARRPEAAGDDRPHRVRH